MGIVVRELEEAKKDIAEAIAESDTSADFVVGDFKFHIHRDGFLTIQKVTTIVLR